MSDDIFQHLDHDAPVIDPTKDYYTEFVGEDKKFKTPQDLARSKAEADAFIKRIQIENAELRKRDQERINMQEFLDQIKNSQRQPDTGNQPPSEDLRNSAVTPEVIDRILTERETERRRQSNVAEVENKLRETFGDDYKRRVQEKASQLGVQTQWLTDVAGRSPQALYELLGVGHKPSDTFTPPPRGVTTPLNLTPENNYAHYERLRKEKGEGWYWSPQVQQEIWKAIRDQGEETFYRTR